MGFRFRKSIKAGPFRINFSRSGVGYSFGGKGARVTKMPNGRTRTTISMPGTGVSYVTEYGSKKGNRRGKQASVSGDSHKHNNGKQGILLLIVMVAILMSIIIGKKSDENSMDKLGEVYNAKQILYMEHHPRIYDSVESVEKYIQINGTSAIKLLSGYEFTKVHYDGAQSESDGVVCFEKGATHKELVECVRLIIDDVSLVPEIDIDDAVSLMNSYLPDDFYEVYTLDCAYIRRNSNVECYVAAFRKTDLDSNYAHYFSFYITHKENELWVMENDFDPYGGLDKGQINDYEEWQCKFE